MGRSDARYGEDSTTPAKKEMSNRSTAMNKQEPETRRFPTWDDMKMESYLNFVKIVTDKFAGRLDQEKLFDGAMKRLKGYYERGIQNPKNIKKFKGWFYVKCRT